jgi:hypothetical protein
MMLVLAFAQDRAVSPTIVLRRASAISKCDGERSKKTTPHRAASFGFPGRSQW